jgi:hypothetical protein
MKKIILMALLLFVLIIMGCDKIDLSKVSDKDLERISDKLIVCDKPYIRHADACCLDQNEDKICDDDQKLTKDKSDNEDKKDNSKDKEKNNKQNSDSGDKCTINSDSGLICDKFTITPNQEITLLLKNTLSQSIVLQSAYSEISDGNNACQLSADSPISANGMTAFSFSVDESCAALTKPGNIINAQITLSLLFQDGFTKTTQGTFTTTVLNDDIGQSNPPIDDQADSANADNLALKKALEAKDETLCNAIKDETLKTHCRDSILTIRFTEQANLTACDIISDPELREICRNNALMKQALAAKNADLCSQITNAYMKMDCLKLLG